MELVTPGLGLLFWQVVTFVVLLFVLTKFAWKPIISALKEREESIENALSAAQKAKDEMAKLTADNEKLLAEARAERDKIIREATTAANTMVNEAKERANVEADRMISQAKETINNEKKAAITEIQNQVASLSLQVAEKILRKELSADAAQNELLGKMIKEVNLN
jgi:F-type H+-transporting ATPase subunit b